MKKRIIGIAVVLLSIFLVATLIGTFATDVTVANNDNTYDIMLSDSTGEITVPAGTSKTAMYQITNTNKGVVEYAVAYSGDNIVVKVYNDTIDPETGTIDYGENKFVKLYIENTGDTESTASIKTVLGYEGGGDLDSIKPSGYTLVTEVYTPPKPINLITHITNLYTNATKTEATNNSITYNYASDIGLMNDRLGTTDVEADAGNIRYYGADPNNYIYYNCDDYSNPTADTCELWRIIGVFKDIEVIEDGTTVTKDMVKIARASTIGTYAWDNKASGIGTSTSSYGSNDWTDARLMMLLNPGYDKDVTDASGNLLNEHGRSYYWNSGSGSCYSGQNNATTTCDFTSTGLKNDETRNMIAKVVWKLGGWNTASGVYPNKLYEYERGSTVYTGRATEWEGHVALMYPSDYGYATDFTKCDKVPYNYDSSTDSYACRTNDWLFISGTIQWLLTPRSSYSYSVWRVNSSGYVNESASVWGTIGVRPVLYLDSEIDIESGNAGTSTDPYRISLR